MLNLRRWILAGVASAFVGLALQANAHLIDPEGNLYVGSNDNAAIMSGLLGADVVLLFKQEYNDGVAGESEGYSQYFEVTNPVGGDNNLATISWDLTGSGYELHGVAWKDGTLVDFKGSKGFYWSAVSADERLAGGPETVSTQPAFRGAVSHVAFYGVRVSDGGTTLLLLGAGLTALGTARRFLKR